MQLPTQGQVDSVLRHVYSTVAGAGAVAVVMGMSPEMRDTAYAAIQQIGGGIASIFAGVLALIPVINGARAFFKSSPDQQIQSINKADNGLVVTKAVNVDPRDVVTTTKLDPVS